MIDQNTHPGDRDVWSIGSPENPRPEDPICGSEEAARKNAAAMSHSSVYAVWHGAELIALYFEGQAWRRG
jgi:hypothetical protein